MLYFLFHRDFNKIMASKRKYKLIDLVDDTDLLDLFENELIDDETKTSALANSKKKAVVNVLRFLPTLFALIRP